MIASTRFSVLDRSRTREGHDAPRALRDTVDLAREAEALGFHRFWVSEHHGVPGVAGSAPTVLAAAVAAATSTIRVGTGGVMLPNHRPLVVAEQFGVLASLFPGRIDMGLGRSVGFTDGVRRALGHGKEDAEDFPGRLTELLGWIDGTQQAHPGSTPIRRRACTSPRTSWRSGKARPSPRPPGSRSSSAICAAGRRCCARSRSTAATSAPPRAPSGPR